MGGEGGGDGERGRDRQTERGTETQRDRDTEREREKQRQRERERGKERVCTLDLTRRRCRRKQPLSCYISGGLMSLSGSPSVDTDAEGTTMSPETHSIGQQLHHQAPPPPPPRLVELSLMRHQEPTTDCNVFFRNLASDMQIRCCVTCGQNTRLCLFICGG